MVRSIDLSHSLGELLMGLGPNKYRVTVSLTVEATESNSDDVELLFGFSESTEGLANVGTDAFYHVPSELAGLYLSGMVAVRAAVQGLAEVHSIVEGRPLAKASAGSNATN